MTINTADTALLRETLKRAKDLTCDLAAITCSIGEIVRRMEGGQAESGMWAVGDADSAKSHRFLAGPFLTKREALDFPGSVGERIYRVMTEGKEPELTHRWHGGKWREK